MAEAKEPGLLDALLDSWERNNRILVNLLGMVPEGGMEARAAEGSPSVGEMLAHIHYVRLVFVEEDVPECARIPAKHESEWRAERDRQRLAAMLNESAAEVREAVKSRVESGRAMDQHYDHPILFLQHMIWHEGYHQGQIKLALKLAGMPIANKQAGPGTWRVWMDKSSVGSGSR